MTRLAEVRQVFLLDNNLLLMIDIQSVKENARVLGLLVVPLVRESFASKVRGHLHRLPFVLMFSCSPPLCSTTMQWKCGTAL